MTELVDEQVEQPDALTFPATLPVLPLKDTIVFADSMTPLAIGQERSVKLIEDVASAFALAERCHPAATVNIEHGIEVVVRVGIDRLLTALAIRNSSEMPSLRGEGVLFLFAALRCCS